MSALGESRPASRVAPWVAGFILPVVAGWAWFSPAFGGPLLVLILAAGLAVWWRPVLALALIPAAMPVLDLAPWTGRFYWSAFDLLLSVCIPVALLRSRRPREPGSSGMTVASLAFVVLGVSLACSTLRALLPWQPIDADSFTSYYSHYNALRIVKGALWAWLFAQVYHRLEPSGDRRRQMFEAGMLVGLLLTVTWIVWERAEFVGLFDFTADYRVTGPFSAMHKGGAYVECYLVVAAAFAAALVLQARRWIARAAGLVLLAGAVYAVMVTYSRNGYAAMLAVLVLTLVGGIRRAGRQRLLISGLVVVVATAVVTPIVGGSFARERLARSQHDLAVREAHWMDALRMRDDDAVTALFGEGLGRFPELHYWRSQEPVHAATYRLVREGDNEFLRLGPGATLYMEQIVRPSAGGQLVIRADLRSQRGPADLTVMLCEKWLLTSARCASARLAPAGNDGQWQHAQATVDAPWLAGRSALAPPVKLALLTPAGDATIDVDNVRLVDGQGSELLANGDFSAELDHWFFSTDKDPPWHIHSLPVSVLFDQGWFGVLAWFLLLLTTVGAAARRIGLGVTPALAASVGFLVCGSLNTLIDAPRFLWLLLVMLWLTQAMPETAAGRMPARGPGSAPPAPGPRPSP